VVRRAAPDVYDLHLALGRGRLADAHRGGHPPAVRAPELHLARGASGRAPRAHRRGVTADARAALRLGGLKPLSVDRLVVCNSGGRLPDGGLERAAA
jgi:hypothetical protein